MNDGKLRLDFMFIMKLDKNILEVPSAICLGLSLSLCMSPVQMLQMYS